ncbi:MAG: hypothetical protein EOP91_09275 [Lysobacteraceae bacterium]|nr:MAG: hypothetical protein EOP91_09275 [Xanthomonadaceae bacterium]
MKKYLLVLLAIVAGAVSSPSRAASPGVADSAVPLQVPTPQDALTTCLLGSTTEGDRRTLVKWIFLVMSRYPDVAPMMTVQDDERQRINRQAGGIFERLMVDNCGSELKLALRKSGTDAISKSFEVLGETAMGALLEDPDVNAASASLMAEVDMGRLARTLEGK